MRNSNPPIFFYFFLRHHDNPPQRQQNRAPFCLPPPPSTFPILAKLVTIVTVTVHAHHRKEGVIIPLYSMNYPFQKL